jgi:anionic cell wall polymer biosynthesis LytR-Cps2A-Psr (LCP) family protein
MKKIFLILLVALGVYTTTAAQTTSAPASPSISKQKNKANKEAIDAQKKTDKQSNALVKKQAKGDSVNPREATYNVNERHKKKQIKKN